MNDSERRRIDVLRKAPMFSALDEEAAEAFLRDGRILTVAAGGRVFWPGEKAERFFVVLEGRVKIYKVSPRGDEQILHLYGPGESFGEAAVWAGRDYPAFADAADDSTLLVLSRAQLLRRIEQQPELAIGMFAGLSGKLREFAALIEQLSLRDVPARLAAALLTEADTAGQDAFRLSQTKRQLAGRIGSTPETLSRTLRKLSEAGVLSVNGSEVRILDRDRLEQMADGQ